MTIKNNKGAVFFQSFPNTQNSRSYQHGASMGSYPSFQLTRYDSANRGHEVLLKLLLSPSDATDPKPASVLMKKNPNMQSHLSEVFGIVTLQTIGYWV